MAKQVVTLYLDDTSLRLMVSDGREIKEWAELPLEPGLVKNNVVVKEAEVSAKLQQLFKERKVATKEIVLGVSGLRCLSRPLILPQLPKEMLSEAVMREAKRVLPVPPEQLYISWQTIPAPEGKVQVFLVGLPRPMADALFKTLRQAGLKPTFIDVKPLLLARVVKEATAVVVDVQATEFDIVVMNDGVPQPIRTVSFASETLSWEEKLTTINNELNRTITFYNSNNPERNLAATVPILASGELANKSESCQAVSQALGHPVLPLASPLTAPAEFDAGRYMANIGLVLPDVLSGKEAGPLLINLNLVPVAYRPKPISLTKVLALPAAAMAVGFVVFLMMLTQAASAEVASTRDKVNSAERLLKQRTTQRQVLTDNVTKLEKEVAQVEASLRNFTAALGSLEKQAIGISRDLETATKTARFMLSLKSISHANNVLKVSGRAPGEKEILAYFQRLESSGQFGVITLTSMNRDVKTGEMAFELQGSPVKPSAGAGSIELIIKRLPAATSLTSVAHTGGTLTVSGRSPNENEVLSYLWDLLSSGKFAEITISSMKAVEDKEGKRTDFSLVLKVAG